MEIFQTEAAQTLGLLTTRLSGLLLLARFFGARGAFAAQPASDLLGVLIAGGMLWQVYRRYPVSASVSGQPPAVSG